MDYTYYIQCFFANSKINYFLVELKKKKLNVYNNTTHNG